MRSDTSGADLDAKEGEVLDGEVLGLSELAAIRWLTPSLNSRCPRSVSVSAGNLTGTMRGLTVDVRGLLAGDVGVGKGKATPSDDVPCTGIASVRRCRVVGEAIAVAVVLSGAASLGMDDVRGGETMILFVAPGDVRRSGEPGRFSGVLCSSMKTSSSIACAGWPRRSLNLISKDVRARAPAVFRPSPYTSQLAAHGFGWKT